MKFIFFGDSSSKPRKPARETFTHRRQPKYTSTSSPPPKSTPKPKLPKCLENGYIPHHRNLGLKPWASRDDIKDAWRRTSIRFHPDKIRDPSQKEVAAAAMVLVNEAYEKLYKDDGWWGWLLSKDEIIDSSERLRRLVEKTEGGACEEIVRRKPWFWAYNEQLQCTRDGNYLCGVFWAMLTHNIVDNFLPLGVSDAVWELVDKEWRYPSSPAPDFEKFSFYGPCFQTYTVKLPSVKTEKVEPPRWSNFRDTKCNAPLNPGPGDAGLLLILLIIFLVLTRKIWLALIDYSFKAVIFCVTIPVGAIFWFVRKMFWFCTWPVRKLFALICLAVSYAVLSLEKC
jgi:hypothetical protein